MYKLDKGPLLKYNNYKWCDLETWGFLSTEIPQYAGSLGWQKARALLLEIAQDKAQSLWSAWKARGRNCGEEAAEGVSHKILI